MLQSKQFKIDLIVHSMIIVISTLILMQVVTSKHKYIFMATTIYDVTLTARPKLDSKPKEKGSQLSPLLVLQSALLS